MQLEYSNDFISIHDGGSDDSKMIGKLTGQINDTTISIPHNQLFVTFHTNEAIVMKGFHALIIESKCISKKEIDHAFLVLIIYACNFHIHVTTYLKFINFYFIDDHCQYWLNKTAGTLTSPNFGINFLGVRKVYGNNLNCSWILNADEGFYISLEIDYFLVNNKTQFK